MIATRVGPGQPGSLRATSHWCWLVIASAVCIFGQSGCSSERRRVDASSKVALPTPAVARLPVGFSRAPDLPRRLKGRPKGLTDASVIDYVSGPVGEQVGVAKLKADIWVTEMMPAEGVTLRDVAIPLRWGVQPTQTTDDKDSMLVTVSRARFRLVNGRECFQWTARQFTRFSNAHAREPFLEAILFQAGGKLYMIAMRIAGAVSLASVSANQYGDAWSDALSRFNAVVKHVVPRVAPVRERLSGIDIEAPPGFMRIAGSAGSERPLGDEQDLKRVFLCGFQGVGPLVAFPGGHGVPPATISVSELIAKRARSLNWWARVLRSGVPAQGGLAKGGNDAVRFSPLRKTTIASVPVVAWTGTGRRNGVYTEVAGAVFSKNGHSYFVSTARLEANGPPKGEPDAESTAVIMVRQILRVVGSTGRHKTE